MPGQADLLRSPYSLREGSVVLRPFTRRNLYSPEYLRWMNDPRVTRTIGRFDYHFPVSRAKLVDYFNSIDTDTSMFFAIYAKSLRRSSERFVGTFKIYDLDRLARRASIGIVVGEPKAWDRGIASAAIRAACRFIFDELGFRKVTAGYHATNIGMHRAFEKNGFQVEGVLRDQLYVAGNIVDHVLVCKFGKGKA
jgi:RimJ/RimL family protein N-acetyltransferase